MVIPWQESSDRSRARCSTVIADQTILRDWENEVFEIFHLCSRQSNPAVAATTTSHQYHIQTPVDRQTNRARPATSKMVASPTPSPPTAAPPPRHLPNTPPHRTLSKTHRISIPNSPFPFPHTPLPPRAAHPLQPDRIPAKSLLAPGIHLHGLRDRNGDIPVRAGSMSDAVRKRAGGIERGREGYG